MKPEDRTPPSVREVGERSDRPLPAWLPEWARRLSELYISGTTSMFVLHGIDPYTYLVDVLQRVDLQPQSRVHELTPRLWKDHFGDAPLGSWAD